ncbi:hypothetical protein C7974DRAFT_314860 [Boeremia exigua]|uniref:uncharacterized protein n=1 Tax=Boeremia exigua TaxID=749465 RepID=UPI001E8D14C9|nr:uncharacterized protein C7974DRAFT_314860 [Boeremia exigua]KAH6621958.1 hypothetical protein C7974DRAFT_314860 [Boeremia exigua]
MPDQPAPEPPTPPGPPKHNILISIPRTASNLLTHLLALPSQPSILRHPHDGYFFLPALVHRLQHNTLTQPYTESLETQSSPETPSLDTALRTSASAYEAFLLAADAQGKGTYIKEHVNWTLRPEIESAYLHPGQHSPLDPNPPLDPEQPPFNPTALPTSVWRRTQTTLLIRHPAQTVPSALRTALANEGRAHVLTPESAAVMRWECSFRWHVLLYRFLQALSRGGETPPPPSPPPPLILDATHLLSPTLISRYAHHTGLSPTPTLTSWPPASASETQTMSPTELRMRDTLLASTGVVGAKLEGGGAGWEWEGERSGWEEEFGGELAGRVEGLVRAAVGDYEWLFARRWRG